MSDKINIDSENTIHFYQHAFNIDEFEQGSDLNETDFLNSTTESGTFTVSTGEVFDYQFNTDLFIKKRSL